MIRIKVGILTVPFNNNYGGFLQAYALMKILKDLGCQPYMIMRRHDLSCCSILSRTKIIFKGFIKALKYRNHHILFHPFESNYFIRGHEMQKFVSRYIIPQTSYFYSWSKLEQRLKGRFDAIIVGSDQVWRSIYVPGIENYFLEFSKKWTIKRIAYAASFGTNHPEYTNEEIINCGKLLNFFDSISVREKGALLVFNNFNWRTNGIKVVLDPTLLLNRINYESLIGEKKQETSYIFAYILDKSLDIDVTIKHICESKGMELKTISNIQDENVSLPSIEDWLRLISNAKYVITDSFHGMVFSIIFHIPFVVTANKRRGADRFESLLNILNIDERLCYNSSEIQNVMLKPIKWEQVDSSLNTYRAESINFLKNSLNFSSNIQ